MMDKESTIAGIANSAAEPLSSGPDLATLYPNDVPAEPKAGTTDAPTDAPADYQLTAPEGYEFTPEIMAEVSPVFREIGLSSDHANKLMPLAAKFADRIHQQHADEFQGMKTEWAKQAQADPHIGGAHWAETSRLVGKALDIAGIEKNSELMKLLGQSGLGNHPEMLRAMRTWGAQAERPGKPLPTMSREQVWYPNG